jgi:hypothetical protein
MNIVFSAMLLATMLWQTPAAQDTATAGAKPQTQTLSQSGIDRIAARWMR